MGAIQTVRNSIFHRRGGVTPEVSKSVERFVWIWREQVLNSVLRGHGVGLSETRELKT